MEKQIEKYNNIKDINKDIRNGKIKKGETIILNEIKQSQKGMIKIEDVWIKLDTIILNHRRIHNKEDFEYNTNNPHIELILDLEALKQSLKELGEKE